jgi:hypothetical protein
MRASTDPRFAEDIVHLERLIAESDENDIHLPGHYGVTNALTKPSTADSIAHLSKGD